MSGEWMQWQIMGKRCPGRWSSRHYTDDGLRTLCGKKIPHRYQMFRTDAIVDECPGCRRKVDARLFAIGLAQGVKVGQGKPLVEVVGSETDAPHE